MEDAADVGVQERVEARLAGVAAEVDDRVDALGRARHRLGVAQVGRDDRLGLVLGAQRGDGR